MKEYSINNNQLINKNVGENIIIKPSCELMDLKEIFEKEIDISKITFKPKLLKDSIYASKNFMETYFRLDKIRIASIMAIEKELSKYDEFTVQNVIEIYIKLSKLTNPYQIPIFLEDLEVRGGEVCVTEICTENCEQGYGRLLFFDSIQISNKITEFTPGIITHEITHTELVSKDDSVKLYENGEILSIFNQLLCCLKLDVSEVLLKKEIAYRKDDIRILIDWLNDYFYHIGSLSKDETLKNFKYLNSTIKGLHMFNLYYFSNFKIQKEIIKDIQKIFDGRYSLEEMLEKYGITYEEGIKILSKEYI